MKVAVDIDNTLWDFAAVLWVKLKDAIPDLPPPSVWHSWDFWKTYMAENEFYRAVKEIHTTQDRVGAPYPEAKAFLTRLKATGHHVIVASHRDEEAREVTRRWFAIHSLPYDDLHLSWDKTVLFKEVGAVVDDSPPVLEAALRQGIKATGLECPWNKALTGLVLHKSLRGVMCELTALPKEIDLQDQPERKEVYTKYLPHIRQVAKSLAFKVGRPDLRDDFISAGFKGLLEAFERFDGKKGAKALTFAYPRIKGAMLDVLREMDWYPKRVRQADKLNDSERLQVVFIDQVTASNDLETGEVLEMLTHRSENVSDILENRDLTSIVMEEVGKLPEREKEIISMMYFDDKTRASVSKAIGRTPARVSQLHDQAISVLRERVLARVA